MHRRRLLTTLPLVAGLAGCGGLSLDADERTPTARPPETTPPVETPTRTDTDSSSSTGQFVSVKNSRPSTVYLTLVIDGPAAVVESFELFPGEEVRLDDVAASGADRDVVLETAAGERASFRWHADPALDGLATYLTADGVAFWRHARCRPDCALALSERVDGTDLPLAGDGTGRWYAPAGVVVQNPASTARTVDLGVSLRDQSLLSTRYRLPSETQLSVPVAYRSGEYALTVGVDGREVTDAWPVPQVPERHVLLGESVTFGCGPANTTLTLSNRNTVAHTLTVEIVRAGRTVFERRLSVEAGTDRRLVPVDVSGPYEVTVEAASTRETTSTATTATWWACPPRGPATVLIDATGSVRLLQGGPQPG
ncbi:hypothetical protein SAMN04487948_101320 [Halogranum amylolyticum]|uniref:Ig-like domain-containing protein n=1 Tax=Halogranum amylolyticum TaxID=660520 RepID=A0A1H8N588_9EURY|nr:hypothetical protein [Halogranum amylolyticum]SEO24754.1 hypothetical protein SAMN04487948_101320 [Halogranum amylolyticum]